MSAATTVPLMDTSTGLQRIGWMVMRATLLGLFAFLIFGPLLNLEIGRAHV